MLKITVRYQEPMQGALKSIGHRHTENMFPETKLGDGSIRAFHDGIEMTTMRLEITLKALYLLNDLITNKKLLAAIN